MKRILKFILIVLLIGVVLLVFLTALGVIQNDDGELLLSYLGLLLALILAVALILLTILLIFTVVRFAVARVSQATSIQAASETQRLVALAVAAITFPAVIASVYELAVRLTVELFEIPRSISRVTMQGMSCMGNNRIDDCVPMFFNNVMSASNAAINNLFFRSGLYTLNVRELFFAVVVFVVVSLVLTRISNLKTDRSKFWLAYATIAVMSVYLALSATLAVPLIREGETQVVGQSAEQLRDRLTTIARPLTDQISSAGKKDTGTKNATIIADDADKVNNSAIIEVRKIQGEIAKLRDEIISQLDELTESTPTFLEGIINSAIDLYQAETLIRLGQREASRHYLDIASWFSEVIQSRERILIECQRTHHELKGINDSAAEIVRELVVSNSEVTVENARATLYSLQRQAFETMGRCQIYQKISSSPPSRPFYGSSLGPVGVATRWLLSAESMPVTLLTGLVGFGLLGALVSRFVRTPRSVDNMETSGEITVVVFSGFVAALVVYVGAYGGIAIASETGSDPNPYVVFGACLIGAIYSSEVWEKARQRMLNSDQGIALGQKQEQGRDQS